MKPRLISPYSLLVGTLLLLAPLAATAQVSLASQHGDLGDRALASQQHATALTEYVLAYAYDSTAERLMKIASTYQAMGNTAVAIELYDRVAVLAGSRPVAAQARSQANGLRGANAAPMRVQKFLT